MSASRSPAAPAAGARTKFDDVRSRSWPAIWVALAILAVRIPFLLVHPLLEDAYITFRSARHLAEAGDLSFNLHQHFPGTTSLLYPLLVAFFDLLLRSHMILGVQIVGTLCVTAASYLIASALCEPGTQRRVVWLLTACWPIALVMSYDGMETSLLVLALSGCIVALAREGHGTLFSVCILLLPLLRPDALGYAVIFCGAMLLLDRRAALRGIAALALGSSLFMAGTRITTGHFLPTTAHAKQLAYHPEHSAAAVLARMRDLYLGQSFLLPIITTYLARLSPLLFAIVIAAFVWWLAHARSRRERILAATLAIATVAVPLAYAMGGVIFAWYLYPANWIAAAVTIAVAVRVIATLRFRMAIGMLVGLLWVGMAAMQWGKAIASATEDYHFRGDIGRYLGDISRGQGTLFLEPAGLIPYFSNLNTVDEVGLVSPRITAFMQHDPAGWWFDYVSTDLPDFIVQRQSFEHYETFQKYTLTPTQQQWFAAHYKLVRRAHYQPSAYHPNPALQRVFRLGRIEDYLIYQRRNVAALSR